MQSTTSSDIPAATPAQATPVDVPLAHAALALRFLATNKPGIGQPYDLDTLRTLAAELDQAARTLSATSGHGIEGSNFTMRLVGATAALRFFAAGHIRPERADMPFHAERLRQLAAELDQAVELLHVQRDLARAASKPWQGYGGRLAAMPTFLPGTAPKAPPSTDLPTILAQVRAALQYANDTGAIIDTIWLSPSETLFDFLDRHLAPPVPLDMPASPPSGQPLVGHGSGG